MSSKSHLNGHGPVLDIKQLHEVTPEEVQWLWPSRIPRAKITLLAGNPDLGKSYMSLDIAARISLGKPWPDGSGNAPKGRVAIVSAEDDTEDTIVPRLQLLGADLRRIRAFGMTVQRGDEREFLTLTQHLNEVVEELQRVPTTLLVIDPIKAFTSGVDTHKEAEVRSLMLRLREAAKNTGCAILGVDHLNKRSAEPNSHYRFGGSLAFVAAVRAAMMVGVHPEYPEKRVLAQSKSNLASRPDSISYSIDESGFVWGDQIVLAADDMLIRKPKQPKVEQAKEFLRSYPFVNGSALTQDVMEAAKAVEIGESSLEKAKADLGIKSKYGSDGRWYWQAGAVLVKERT